VRMEGSAIGRQQYILNGSIIKGSALLSCSTLDNKYYGSSQVED
jgi:hypothetical protein